MNRVLLLVLTTSLLLTACSNLAQLAFGEALRDDLIIDCCECLADSSTRDSTATCTEAVLVDGQIVVPNDAVYGSDDDNISIPCLCDSTKGKDECIADLHDKTPILIPGACVDQLDGEGPCESACAGVLSFSPVPG